MADISISVIIPLYNNGPFFRECLESVYNQADAPPFEVIIVDDGSTDDSREIADSYAHRTETTVVHQLNMGLSEARNTGIRSAKGKYILFIDSDDVIFPHTLATLWKHVVTHPGVQIVYGKTVVSPDIPSRQKRFDMERFGVKSYDNRLRSVKQFHSKVCETAWNRLILREWLIGNNLFFSSRKIQEDFEWQLRAYDYIENYAAETQITTYRYNLNLNSNSLTGKLSLLDRRRNIFSILISVIPNLKKLDGPVMRLITDNILNFKAYKDDETDETQYRQVITEILRHPSARWWHRILVASYRFYLPWMPRRPILNLFR